jgi:hypothetical protein
MPINHKSIFFDNFTGNPQEVEHEEESIESEKNSIQPINRRQEW